VGAGWALRPGWMAGVVEAGLIVVGPRVELAVAMHPARAAGLVAAVGEVSDGPRPAADEDLAGLRALLAEHGGLDGVAAGDGAPRPGIPLAEAVARARDGQPPGPLAWTAEEALVLPADLDSRTRARALRAFVAGLRPAGRLEAYARVARGDGAVAGDRPAPDDLRRRLTEAAPSPGAISVVDLRSGGGCTTVPPGDLDRIGADGPHRLGPILRETVRAPASGGEEWQCVAEIAVGNLAVVGPEHERLVQGLGPDEAHARLVARAEGAERFAAAELSGTEIVRATRAELPGAVDPAALYLRAEEDGSAGSAAGEARLWAPVTDRAGGRRWVPAEAVHTTVVAAAPPAAVLPWTSSGLAAHTDPAAARERAFHELVERDAFMWTWIQRVSRERVRPRSAPAGARALAARVGRAGWATHWVNLSLEAGPVLLCCLVHERDGLTVGAAADADPAVALARATAEAATLALGLDGGGAEPPRPRDVRGPRDHALLHRDPARAAEHGFLYASGEELELGDVPAGGGDVAARLHALGFAPLAADLTIPAVRPFHVVRALAPGLLPLTFGYGTEPLGMPRARGPVDLPDGRRLGLRLGAGQPGIVIPHPFP